MTHPDSNYEPPAAEVVSTEHGPAAVTAAASTDDPYTSITLIDDDGKKRSDT